jgi:hypothetical protein
VNIERIPERLMKWGVIAVGILLAIFLGRQIGNGEFGKVSLILLAGTVGAVALAIPNRIWMPVVLLWPLLGQIPALGLPVGVRDIIIGAVFCVFLPLIAFKVIKKSPSTGGLDLMVWFTALYLVTTLIRNPVGVAAIEGDRVGGRPYFNVFVAFLAYWILSRSAISAQLSKKFAISITASRMVESLLTIALMFFPVLGRFFSEFYVSTALSLAGDENSLVESVDEINRLAYLGGIGGPILYYLFTAYRPLSCLKPLNFWRFGLFLIGISCILLSGFRSSLMGAGAVAVVSSYLHRGWSEVARISGLGLLALIFLVVGQGTVLNLPRSMQRTLSFLPGDWDPVALMEAQESTRWRVEMWKEMLFTDKHIDSRIFGDGFGFKRTDYERMQAKKALGISGDQEDFMTSGAVHSGPVSAIHKAGYVGLALHLIFLGAVAGGAWRLIKRAKGTQLQTLVYLICIPAVTEPFFFVLVFGGYENSVPETFFTVGILRMLSNSLDNHTQAPMPTEMVLPDIPEWSARTATLAKS